MIRPSFLVCRNSRFGPDPDRAIMTDAAQQETRGRIAYSACGPVAVPLILASGSPRRRDLLQESGYSFIVIPPDASAEDAADESLDGYHVALDRACLKANNVAGKLARREGRSVSPQVILACDSVVVCRNELLGKPLDVLDAERMLRLLSGTRHEVHTGVCLKPLDGRAECTFVETSILTMDALSEEQLESYLASNQWRGKAGAFGWQDGNDWLRLERGSGSNVVGLPLERLACELERFRI
ncbi:MAG: Maf family protein [Planctomycetia bacterium]|nr:Maf family protein [Planctomycetia bacterium]